MSVVPLAMRIIASSIIIANRAGTIIRDVMTHGELGIVEKGKDDLQTQADRSAQLCIIASLANQFPNVKVIGEEGATDISDVPSDWIITGSDQDFLSKICPENLKNVSESDVVIWVDPLDGTSEYTKGYLEHVTVMIGLSIRDEAVGGVLHQPYFNRGNGDNATLGRTLWGLKGLGTSPFEKRDPHEGLIVTTTRSHSTEMVQSALNALEPKEIIRVGGAGFKVLQLLEGQADAYIFASNGCKKWDTCAPEAILEAHGGTLTNVLGNHYKYGAEEPFPNQLGVIATAQHVNHTEIIEKIPREIKEALSQ